MNYAQDESTQATGNREPDEQTGDGGWPECAGHRSGGRLEPKSVESELNAICGLKYDAKETNDVMHGRVLASHFQPKIFPVP